jgi:hypothetical protein
VLGRLFGDAGARRADILRVGMPRFIVSPHANAPAFRIPVNKYKKIYDFSDIYLPFVPKMLYNTYNGAQRQAQRPEK